MSPFAEQLRTRPILVQNALNWSGVAPALAGNIESMQNWCVFASDGTIAGNTDCLQSYRGLTTGITLKMKKKGQETSLNELVDLLKAVPTLTGLQLPVVPQPSRRRYIPGRRYLSDYDGISVHTEDMTANSNHKQQAPPPPQYTL